MSDQPPSINAQITAIEKRLGTGTAPSYGPRERAQILEGVVPEWLLRCRLVLKGDDRVWAEKLIGGLTKAREELWPKVRFSQHETTPPPAVKEKGDH